MLLLYDVLISVRGKHVDGSQAPLNIPGFEPGITIVVKPDRKR